MRNHKKDRVTEEKGQIIIRRKSLGQTKERAGCSSDGFANIDAEERLDRVVLSDSISYRSIRLRCSLLLLLLLLIDNREIRREREGDREPAGEGEREAPRRNCGWKHREVGNGAALRWGGGGAL